MYRRPAGARFEIAHLGKLARAADPQTSPDGKSIVVVVSRPNYDDNRYDSELVLVDVATQKQRVLTYDRQKAFHDPERQAKPPAPPRIINGLQA